MLVQWIDRYVDEGFRASFKDFGCEALDDIPKYVMETDLSNIGMPLVKRRKLMENIIRINPGESGQTACVYSYAICCIS